MPLVAPGWCMVALLLALGLACPAAALAQAPRPDRIAFADGADSAIVRGTLRGREVVDWFVAAAPGQRLQAELTASHPAAYLNVRAPGALETTHVGPVRGNVFDGAASTAGEYRLSIFLMGEAARRSEAADYVLSVTVAPRAATATPPPPAPAAAPTAAAPPA
ncbi:hypothetical protein, partial [Falsiroseomonas oryzae]|uniref:hypothetical protein n=1 Tax=Falsiroseomonas oryzae TaxID=2766473 RepID=UPI0022EB16A3